MTGILVSAWSANGPGAGCHSVFKITLCHLPSRYLIGAKHKAVRIQSPGGAERTPVRSPTQWAPGAVVSALLRVHGGKAGLNRWTLKNSSGTQVTRGSRIESLSHWVSGTRAEAPSQRAWSPASVSGQSHPLASVQAGEPKVSVASQLGVTGGSGHWGLH